MPPLTDKAASFARTETEEGTVGEVMETVGDALLREMSRVREIIAEYEATPFGGLAASLMRRSIDRAQLALAEGDVVAMIQCLEDLEGYEL